MKKLLFLFLLSITGFNGFSQCANCLTPGQVTTIKVKCGCTDTLYKIDTTYIASRDTAAVYNLNSTVTSSSWSGSNTEHLMYSYLIPANTLKVGDILSVWYKVTKSGTAGNSTSRIRFGTTNSLSDNLIGTIQQGSTVLDYVWERKYLLIKNSTTMVVFSPTTSAFTDITNGSWSNITINIAVDNYMGFSGHLGSAADTFFFDSETTTDTPH